RHPIQIYEALACLIIFLFLYILFIKKGKKLNMGVISALFLILLFSVRFLVEFLKEPQVDFEKNMFLNMGQLLSIPFIITGIILLIVKLKKPKAAITNS
ncbi:MAG: prolipoprotein diacylglyceryl transferase, partial [Bacteroidales bacterium]|nr:prolipoprotein diacylglyceryl transferase [Bacteroidales bacterium]